MNCKKCDRLQAEVDELWRYRKRAEKVEQERDEAQERNARQADMLAQRRPLTAADITGEMERRAIRKGIEFGWFNAGGVNNVRVRDNMNALLAAALTPPPVTLESIVDEALDKYTGGYLNGDEVGPYVASKYAELTDGSN